MVRQLFEQEGKMENKIVHEKRKHEAFKHANKNNKQ